MKTRAPCKQSFNILRIKPKLRSIKKDKPSLKDSLPGSKIGGYTSSLKMSPCNPHPRFKFYVGTDNIEDLIPFSKTPTGKMEKRVKEEAEMLLNLELQRSQAEAILLDEQRLWSNI